MYSLIYSHEFNNSFQEKNQNNTFNKKVTWLDRIMQVLFK